MIDFTVLNGANDILEDLQIAASLEERQDAKAITIKLTGVLSPVNTGEFTERIIRFFRQDWDKVPLFLDLEALQYISSSGIGIFTTIRMLADHKESPLYLLRMNRKVRQVFDLLGFSGFFRIAESAEDIPV